MLSTLLQIRLIQLRHEVQHLGLRHLLVFAALFVALLLLSYSLFLSDRTYWFATAGVPLLFLLVHLYRPDQQFVYLHLAKPFAALTAEYLVVALPFTAPALFTPHWYSFFICSGLLVLVPLVKYQPKHQAQLAFLSWFLPNQNFEWISGIRKTFWLFLAFYGAAFAFCQIKLLPLFFLWMLTNFIISFY
ncbi:MAG: hypothetical protein LPK19_15110 [Hymenobacteraceae bacterium]|nr:hypothetical protein [Hymenobacteraceae bacterium]MDX5397562.1 hypothetical protein [Hymenobacteraceae bacterium]MDX5513642.1 hypothetical protein [Hymenobacteraceae bacterium]